MRRQKKNPSTVVLVLVGGAILAGVAGVIALLKPKKPTPLFDGSDASLLKAGSCIQADNGKGFTVTGAGAGVSVLFRIDVSTGGGDSFLATPIDPAGLPPQQVRVPVASVDGAGPCP